MYVCIQMCMEVKSCDYLFPFWFNVKIARYGYFLEGNKCTLFRLHIWSG